MLGPDAEPRRDARRETDLPCQPLGDDWPSLNDAVSSRHHRFGPGRLMVEMNGPGGLVVEMKLVSAELYSVGLTGIG